MSAVRPSDRPSLPVFALIYSVFAVGLSAALLVPEATTRVDLHRAIFSIWLSSLFATPAFFTYIAHVAGRESPGASYQVWRLLWTFAALAYLFHFIYVLFSIHRGDAGSVFVVQGAFVASVNFVFTAWWVIDILLLWARPGTPLQRWQNRVFQCFAFVVFAVAFLFLRPGIPQVLGALMVVAALVAVFVRPRQQVIS